ncbi:META domain-containing protein [Lichenihabitans sp. Uapishka_5]|uniref:META domain-containing protein n=1 Tax=Lichenihabitans sp. Uapishka_5 TaxID=3037302 RepID=UPI0029E817F8|nr:META domain-containing protein [Lichenihabitans sp. Uapishka_5]MDX7949870.1 META domain-containing protein [Lichenihabitans sp. Uapishka_5]
MLVAGLALPLSTPVLAQAGPKLLRKQKEEVYKPTGAAEQQFPFGATWILYDIGGRSLSGDAPSFSLDDKLRATGFGGCNTFSMALYPIKDQKLAAGSIAMTRKNCGKPVDDTEHDILVGLHSLPKWHLESNGDLTVVGQGPAMRFKRGL